MMSGFMDKIAFFATFSTSIILMSWFTFYTYSPLVTQGGRVWSSLIAAIIFVGAVMALFALERVFHGKAALIVAWIKSIVLGLGYYFLITAIVASIISLVYTFLGKSMPTIVLPIAVGVAVVCVIVGAIYAASPKVTNYTIATDKSDMADRRIVLVSDLHIGNLNNERFSNRVLALIQKQEPDYVIMAGDVFDGPAIDTMPFTRTFSRLTRDTPTFFAPGNHEEYGPYNTFISALIGAGVTVLQDEHVVVDGMNIVGLKYRGQQTTENDRQVEEILQKNLVSDSGAYTIVINHAPTFIQKLSNRNVDLVVSGHTHRGQFWPNRYITRLAYGRYHYGQNLVGNMYSITTNGIGVATVYNRLFNRPEVVVINFIQK
jgi:uncharacterized protein